MQFTAATVLAIIGFAAAMPAPEAAALEERTGIQVANFVFQGGPASYSMQVPADGNYYPTSASPIYPQT